MEREHHWVEEDEISPDSAKRWQSMGWIEVVEVVVIDELTENNFHCIDYYYTITSAWMPGENAF